MNRDKLKKIIRESVEEIMNDQFVPFGVAETGTLEESGPPNFPKKMRAKIIAQYKKKYPDNEERAMKAAYGTMWKIFYAKKNGHKKVNEMWTAFEDGMINEADGVGTNVRIKAEVDNTVYPMSSEEIINIVNKYSGVKIKMLGDASFGTETSNRYTFELAGPSGQVDALIGELAEENGIDFVDVLNENAEGMDQNEEHDETDLSNPEEKKEVELATKMKDIALELLAMHGVEGKEGGKEDEESENEESDEEESEESDEENAQQLDEKWNKKDVVHPSKKGMFKGKTKAELEKQLNVLKKKGPYKKGSKEYTKMKELQFAIRAKSGWGKVKK